MISKTEEKKIKKRFYELKNQIAELRKEDLETSNKVAAKDTQETTNEETFKVVQKTSRHLEYKASDLPLYFKCERSSSYYRVRRVIPEKYLTGNTVTDVLRERREGLTYDFGLDEFAFRTDNIQITEDEWRNVMHKFIKQISA
mgnify:CR=1 FL=1